MIDREHRMRFFVGWNDGRAVVSVCAEYDVERLLTGYQPSDDPVYDEGYNAALASSLGGLQGGI